MSFIWFEEKTAYVCVEIWLYLELDFNFNKTKTRRYFNYFKGKMLPIGGKFQITDIRLSLHLVDEIYIIRRPHKKWVRSIFTHTSRTYYSDVLMEIPKWSGELWMAVFCHIHISVSANYETKFSRPTWDTSFYDEYTRSNKKGRGRASTDGKTRTYLCWCVFVSFKMVFRVYYSV